MFFRLASPGQTTGHSARVVVIVMVCLGWLLTATSLDAVAADDITCGTPLTAPDTRVLLRIPDSVSRHDYQEIEDRVRQRMGLLGTTSCFVKRVEETIAVDIAFGMVRPIPIADLQHILSRRGYLQIVEAESLVATEKESPDPLTVENAATPIVAIPNGSVILSSDDFERVFITPTIDGVMQVAFEMSPGGYSRFRSYANNHQGESIAFISDGRYWFSSKLTGTFTVDSPFLLIGGIDPDVFMEVASYLAAESYPVELQVLD